VNFDSTEAMQYHK